MKEHTLLGIHLKNESKKIILEKIQKYILSPRGFYHIVSVNPEIAVAAVDNHLFRDCLNSANITLADGIGIKYACMLLNIPLSERLTGVETMKLLLEYIGKERLTALLIGGNAKVADSIAQCYQKEYPRAHFIGIEGISDIDAGPTPEEEKAIQAIVTEYKPHIVFASFGSPAQELWLASHSNLFNHCVGMGVGGAFDFLSHSLPRAPRWMRSMGLEWVYRLLKQPWRWRRQLRLIRFIYLVFLQKIGMLRIE